MIHLILGGAKSGKSYYAEKQIMQHNPPWIYLATAQAYDHEMKRKIELHKQRRSDQWLTIEEPIHLCNILNTQDGNKPILIDCLTLWLSNLTIGKYDISIAIEELISSLIRYKGVIFLVSNELGHGIVPANRQTRIFRDYSGILNQRIADIADHFTFVIAGCPLIIK